MIATRINGRFASSGPDYRIDPETGCWEWLKYRNPAGYGLRTGGPGKRTPALERAMKCSLCQQSVNPADRYVVQRVVGWERRALSATRRGGSDILLREHLEEYAHSACVEKAKLGVSPQQAGLAL